MDLRACPSANTRPNQQITSENGFMSITEGQTQAKVSVIGSKTSFAFLIGQEAGPAMFHQRISVWQLTALSETACLMLS